MDSGEEVAGGFFIASCDASELFESIEETLNQIALRVEGEVALAADPAVGLARDHRLDAAHDQGFNEAVGVVTLSAMMARGSTSARSASVVGLPAFDADHGKAELAQPVEQDGRHASGLEYDPTTAWRFRQFAAIASCRRHCLALVNDNTLPVENANVGQTWVPSIEMPRPAK
jgi:hypothetical protein